MNVTWTGSTPSIIDIYLINLLVVASTQILGIHPSPLISITVSLPYRSRKIFEVELHDVTNSIMVGLVLIRVFISGVLGSKHHL